MKCELCPRMCWADREKGELGFCGLGPIPTVRRAAPHMWEEPCICGPGGSGTIFFGGCNLRCVYCQNAGISREKGSGAGSPPEKIADICLALQSEGVSNVNFVTPTPWVNVIKSSLEIAWDKGFFLPVVYNTGGYDSVGAIKSLRGYVSVYLPDFKYSSDELAVKYSSAPGYAAAALSAINEMSAQVGPPSFDGDGMLRRGVIVRHLVLPGYARESAETLRALYRGLDDPGGVIVSVMSQYTPQPGVPDELNRTVGDGEYRLVCEAAEDLGFYGVYTQDGSSASESFIPEWDRGPAAPTL
ncbi:MAG: radical SAM protein [Clostridia bacterium]|nr:radical SAM protein [Clostridia bacterium]